jgi:hypothetical protein
VRVLPVLSAAGVVALLGCPHESSSPGKADGEPCTAAIQCRSALCFEGACASSTPPSAACPSPPGAPTIVAGATFDPGARAPGSCVTTVRDPLAAMGFVDLGTHTVGQTVTFDVPPGTRSFSILSQEVPGTAEQFVLFQGFLIPNSVVPSNIREPGGALFYSDLDPLPHVGLYNDVTGVLAYYGGLTVISGAFTVPNTSAALDLDLTAGSLPSGTWSFLVNDFSLECLSVPGCSTGTPAGQYHIQVVMETRPFASTGKLDVEVYLATDPSSVLPSAAFAASDAQFARWVKSFGAYYAKAGICLGTVTVHDLPAWAKALYAPSGVLDVSGSGQGVPPANTPPGCDDLSQLFTLGLAPSQAVHLFFADELVDRGVTAGFTVLGVDGSIPGPSGVPGTVNGGAVVGVFDLLGAERSPGACSAGGPPNVSTCGTDVLALVSAHEAGHWLGLYHTTELDGTVFDPLTDTETCACLACAPFALRSRCAERNPFGTPTVMSSSFCIDRKPRCGGGDNLMFWLFDERFSTGEISRQQGDVMRRNPAVQ